MRLEVEKGLKLSITEGGNEEILGGEVSGMQQKRRSTPCKQCGDTKGMDLMTRTHQLGAKEKAKRKR